MSVVNQMLRDLDRRQVVHDALPLEPTPAAKPSRLKWIAIGTGIAVTGLAAAVIARAPEQARQPATIAVTPAAPAIQPAAIPNLPAVASAEPLPQTAVATPTASTIKLAAPAETSQLVPAASTATRALVSPKQISQPAASAGIANPAPIAATPKPVAPATRTAASDRVDTAILAKANPSAATNEPARIEKRLSEPTTQSADAAFRRAAALIEKGRIADAKIALNAALAVDPDHTAARQTLAALLIESRALDDAQAVLAAGLERDPNQAGFAIILARIKLEQGDQSRALELLFAHRTAAASNPQYLAFLAALLRRAGRHKEAIDEYRSALRIAPGVGAWWIGLGLAQEAVERNDEAAIAFRRARATGTLTADLSDLVERRLGTAQ